MYTISACLYFLAINEYRWLNKKKRNRTTQECRFEIDSFGQLVSKELISNISDGGLHPFNANIDCPIKMRCFFCSSHIKTHAV